MFINSGKFAILTDSIRRMEWSFAICTRASKLLFIPLRGRQVRLCVFFVPRSGRIIPIHLPELLADLGQQGLSGAGHGSTITRHQPPNPSLPVGIDCSGLHIQGTQGFFAQLRHAWWKVRSADRVQPRQLETADGMPDVLIEGIEWPSGSMRSVAVIALRDKDVVANFLSVFLKTSQ